MDIKRKQTKKKNMGLLLAGVGLSLGVCSGALFDGIEIYHRVKSDGLVLLKNGVHLKEGNHKVVITDQFYELLTYQTKESSQYLAISGLKAAYERLNEVNTGVQFELCTTVKELSKKYSVGYTESFDVKNDIPLYLTEEAINNNITVLAKAVTSENFITRETYNNSIIFKKDTIFSTWIYYPNPHQTNAPKNTSIYSIAMHETLHIMGFAHTDNECSLMYPEATCDNIDLSKEDIEMIARYNEIFYGKKQKEQNKIENDKAEEYLIF